MDERRRERLKAALRENLKRRKAGRSTSHEADRGAGRGESAEDAGGIPSEGPDGDAEVGQVRRFGREEA